ncbi:hypothetical protein LA635_2308 [Erwinia amylovora LA635]|nr:hypothetical protein LA635_2308 [Erwinia amylovora LA635]CDK19299.1 hypothetical protein LA636_2307 [Erwinia amylovora LA636]CDK22670.1 hypothetical protein LA637_2310 [Erwinia amylovora LA637]
MQQSVSGNHRQPYRGLKTLVCRNGFFRLKYALSGVLKR